MVKVITEKFSTYPMTSFGSTRQNNAVKTENTETPKTKNNNKKDKLVPLGLIAGGGLLVYYGIKRPSTTTLYKNLVTQRCYQIESYVQDFSLLTKKLVKTSFDEPLMFIEKFKQSKNIDTAKHLEEISLSQKPQMAVELLDKAFKDVRLNFDESIGAGASDFDTFAVTMDNSARKVRDILNAKRSANNVACGDLTLVPHLKGSKYSDLVEDCENNLTATANSAYNAMARIQDNCLHDVIKSQSRLMAKVVTDFRNLTPELKSKIMDEAFNSVRKLLNLPETFTPSYSKETTLTNFEKLAQGDLEFRDVPKEVEHIYDGKTYCEFVKNDTLKPQDLLKELENVFDGNIYWNTVKTADFSELKPEDIKKIFYSASPYNTVKDIGFMIDRIRLSKEIDKSLGKNNEKVYDNSIAKLEYLSVKLKEVGEKELLEKCSKDFDTDSLEQRKVLFYYVNSLAKKLGYSDITQMDKHLSETNAEYNKMSIRKYIDIYRENPDIYFS